MGDALGKLIVIAAGIALALYVLSIAIVAGLYGAALSLAGGAALAIHRATQNSQIAAAGSASLQVVTSPNGFDLQPDPQHVERVAANLRSAAIFFACVAAALAAAGATPFVLSQLGATSNTNIDTVRAWATAIGGGAFGIYASYWLATKWSFEPTIREAAEEAAKTLTAPMRTVFATLQAIEDASQTVVESVGLPPSPSRHDELVSAFDRERQRIMSDPSAADAVAAEVMASARSDAEALSKIAISFKKMTSTYNVVLDRIVAAGHTSLLSRLDEVRDFIESGAVHEATQHRNFDWILSNIAGVQQSLEAVGNMVPAGGPAQRKATPADIWDDTLSIRDNSNLVLARLNANSDSPPELVRILYLALVKAYNTDQGVIKDARRFQQINDAYAEAKRLGISK